VSGKPLTDDISKSLQTTLTTNGIKVSVVNLPLGTDEATAIKRLATTGNMAVLIVINEWKSDTYVNTKLAYDIQALVIDASGKALSSKRTYGEDNLGSTDSSKAAPMAFRKKLEELFAAPEISNYLNQQGAPNEID